MQKKIVIIDASSATCEIHNLPEHLENAQCEEVEEYFNITSDSEYIFGDIIISDNTK